MNNGILAARTQEATAAIERETRRLGGELTIRPTRGDAAHQQLFTLETIAAALAGIGAPAGNAETEPVEAVIAVAKEPKAADEPKPAPKAKQAKGA
ncbi:MAG: hypothetical protein KBG73_15585 [Candidatus Promineofilum sp.]|nr:hypothetical protein [Promineifilum sp.]